MKKKEFLERANRHIEALLLNYEFCAEDSVVKPSSYQVFKEDLYDLCVFIYESYPHVEDPESEGDFVC